MTFSKAPADTDSRVLGEIMCTTMHYPCFLVLQLRGLLPDTATCFSRFPLPRLYILNPQLHMASHGYVARASLCHYVVTEPSCQHPRIRWNSPALWCAKIRPGFFVVTQSTTCPTNYINKIRIRIIRYSKYCLFLPCRVHCFNRKNTKPE